METTRPRETEKEEREREREKSVLESGGGRYHGYVDEVADLDW